MAAPTHTTTEKRAVPACSSSLISSPVVELDDTGPEPPHLPAAMGLLEVLEKVADPRTRCGRRFRLTSILAVALAATPAGARLFAAIGE
jgi:hypothetical protein